MPPHPLRPGSLGLTPNRPSPGTGPTIQTNPEYLAARAKWTTKDCIAANIAAVTPAHPPMRMEKWWETETRPVFVYSGQKLQYTEWQKEQIRERAVLDPKNHYTYSQQYLSGSLCPVNAEQLEESTSHGPSLPITPTRLFSPRLLSHLPTLVALAGGC